MASAQVLSNSAVSSRKQEHLEAGKRRLEEFRKKKAAAKKAVTSSQPRADAASYEKQASENGPASLVSSVSAAAVDGRSDVAKGTSGFLDHNDKSYGFSHDSGSESVPLAPGLLQMLPKQAGSSHGIPGLRYPVGSAYPQQTDDKNGSFRTDIREGSYADAASSGRPSASQDDNTSNFHSTFYGVNKDISSSVSLPWTNASTNDVTAKVYPEGHVTNLSRHESDSVQSSPDLLASASELGPSQYGALEFKNYFTFGLDERKPSNEVGNLSGFGSQQASEPLSVGSKSNVSGSFNGPSYPSYSAAAETYPRRSRPSFLDSLPIVRDSPASGRPSPEKETFTTSVLPNNNFAASSAIQDPSTDASLPTPASSNPSGNFFGNASTVQKSFEHSLESKLEFNSQKHNEDFAALEQHIEDLTQEKFSLQRALEASKALAESLAAENSSFTESYNQQASIVTQLRSEMERLQEEIKARMVELEAIKAEYMNAQLECNAADERAKLLASEVISLEEKALRLRSNELKLERELENSSAEIASYKKKLSSLEKERRDLQQTVDALQEEKKLLQSKLRRASASGISIDFKGHSKKDASTSTNDIGHDARGGKSEQDSYSTERHEDTDNLLVLLQNRSDGFEELVTSIPPDQVQMIQNINSLIAEVMSEKEELMQALMTEVSTSTKLKDLNKELSQKLEIQTQRLELLTAQSMASENILVKQPTGSRIVQESVAYADEGDEVVERVLGWIMKLFPGGPSKRRTSRL